MKLFFDIYHIPQYNFFRNAIHQLGPDQVELGCVNRGKLKDIIQYECPEFTLHTFGDYRHNKGPLSMGMRIILPRMWALRKLFKKNRYDVVGTAHYQANVVAKLLGIPNFSVLDDPRKGVLQLVRVSADAFYLPPFANGYDNVSKFNALKEWAYLSPAYFKHDRNALKEYDLEAGEYFFIREVSTNTSNYLLQEKNIVLKMSEMLGDKIQVLLSLEDKSLKNQYPDSWKILNEPVKDIHSLMYYSKLVMSSGDSMAREGAMLGVPSIYLGNRDMPANRILLEKGMLFKKSAGELLPFLDRLFSGKVRVQSQNEFRYRLLKEWDDVTELILNLIKQLKLQS
ncbi:MAG: DUF354 domain-containing protein [Cytophagales bacterium]|nr:DUF354 domain-containing protein [Cytophagales bacterium]